jgi:HSP20 family molecular chaperone IbpA
MSRLTLFNSPLVLGFDHFERVLDRVSKASTDGYPPYNVEQTGANSLRITLAVAGFSKDELSVSVEEDELAIAGKQIEEADRVYIHRGIAARQFQRRFVLAQGIEVQGAVLEDGLLHIDLVRPEIEARSRTIEIHGSGAQSEVEDGGQEIAVGAHRKRT